MIESGGSAAQRARAKGRADGARGDQGWRSGWIDTLTLTQEEHGLDSGPRRLAAQIAARGARRQARNDMDDVLDLGSDMAARQPLIDRRAYCVEHDPRLAMSREEETLERLRRMAMSLSTDRPHPHAHPHRRDLHMSAPPRQPDLAARPRAVDWSAAQAPSRRDLELLAAEAFAALPPAFRVQCEGVAILVRDFAERETLDSLGIESEFDLMGLYQGVDLTQASVDDAPTDLNRIFLYRRPLLDYWAEHEETLGDLITHVLVHEIGHHFGLSDEEMEAIEAATI